MAIDEKKAIERAKRQNNYVTNYVKKKYDRVSVTLPKGYKDKLTALGVKSVNGLINKLITEEIERLEYIKMAESGEMYNEEEDNIPFS